MIVNNVLTEDITNTLSKGPEHIFIKHWNEVNLLYAKIKFIQKTQKQTAIKL